MTTGKELAIVGKAEAEAKPKVEAEKVGKASEKIVLPVEVLKIHSALLLSADMMIPNKPANAVLGGVHLRRHEKVGRIVATDGEKMFVASYALATPMPSWLKDGITIDGDGLKKRVQIICSVSGSNMVKVSHTKGNGYVDLSDEDGSATFKVSCLIGEYPDFNRALTDGSFIRLDDDGNVIGGEWEPVGINSRYLKHVGDVAKTLDAGLPKTSRSKNGMVVRAYSGSPVQPLVFDFDTWPGAILVLMPKKLSNNITSEATAALLAPATKLTLAALRAHETRQLAWAEEATDPATKASHTVKALGFKMRIREIIARTQAQLVISEEKPVVLKKAPVNAPLAEDASPAKEVSASAEGDTPKPFSWSTPDPEDEEPETEPQDDGGPKPVIHRTPIKLRKRA